MITAKQVEVYNLSGQERMVFAASPEQSRRVEDSERRRGVVDPVGDLECSREEQGRKEGELEPQPVISGPAEAEDEPF